VLKNISDIELENNKIVGVEFKPLKTFPDQRGFFRELIRHNDPFFADSFSQWSHSKMGQNTVKAWHFHHKQIDWWYVPIGLVHVVLFDNRPDSQSYQRKIEFLLGESEHDKSAISAIVRIAPGVLHGCKVLSDTAHLFYITSKTYDTEDEGRFPFNAGPFQHSWGNESELVVAENDRRTHIPKYELSKC